MSAFTLKLASGSPIRRLIHFAIVLSILWLPGCGGSNSGGEITANTNENPVAVDDSAITNQATEIKINVVTNDSDPDGIVQTTGITIVSAANNGTTLPNSDGTITYTPNTGFTGPTDTFTYTVIDAQKAVSNVATVTITINAIPVTADDIAQTNQASPVTINVIANDSDPNTTVLADSIKLVSLPSNGNATANTDGTVIYTPNSAFTGPTDSFTYTITDAQNAVSNIATASVQVNASPVATNDATLTTQATVVIINVIANDNDSDGSLQVDSISINTLPVNGTATANADGTVTYTPNGTFTGPTDTFTYTVLDDLGATSNIATVTININVAPVANDDNDATIQATPVNINVIANDNDVDGTLQANSISIISTPSNGSATANADGTVTYVPDAPFTGPNDTFTYVINDNQGATSNTASVTITINARPLTVDDAGLTNQATSVTINVIANDSDPDGTLQADSIIIIAGPSNGIAVANTDGTVTYTPNAPFTGPTDTFSYTVSDNQNAISNVSVVTVDINLVPLAADNCNVNPQTAPLAGTLSGSDPDTSPGGLIFSLNADGSGGVGPITGTFNKGQIQITNATTGAFTYTPNAHPSRRGTDTFDYRVEDTEGGIATGTITVIIDPKIMPLGDSITQGIVSSFTPALATRIGYRKTLYTSLTSAGFSVDFVGSRSIGTDALGFDADTDSFAGAKDEEIASGSIDIDDEPGVNIATTGIFDMLEANPADVVLLHIGTNDVTAGIPETSAADVQTILTEINRWEDSANGNPVSVVLARIIDVCINHPADCGTGDANVITFNNNVATMISTLTAAVGPDEIILVDQRSTLLDTANNLPDLTLYGNALHPNANGYNLMAAEWLDNLDGTVDNPVILEKCP